MDGSVGGIKMARYTFVTESHWGGDEKKTVEILSPAEVEDIAAETAKEANRGLGRRLSSQDRKLAKVVEQSVAAAKDAVEAKEEVKRFVETARETFREVIEELLAPHYRLLAQHLGIEVPAPMEKPMTIAKERLDEKAGEKKTVTPKQPAALRRMKAKGGKSCRNWKK